MHPVEYVRFDDLVLPEVQKDMAEALAESQIKELDGLSFDDVVKGKGQGLSMLFCTGLLVLGKP
ncbi:hypothetical protein GJ744_008308 [Endocarpon pusillum]|uniref:Uncharacterized protein n=1 Tax=Endocarpon pusillum TaxID=364733 RepID=A0A8H7A7F7_9EURO|nr:hypothetical protein GJ744_008308 [Endocarpon pusillum]